VGRVTDASNKPLANAEVNVVEEETNRSRTAKTGANGEFVVVEIFRKRDRKVHAGRVASELKEGPKLPAERVDKNLATF